MQINSVSPKISPSEKRIHKLILVIGVLLALGQYGYNRSIWLDEAMLTLNIVERGYMGLLQPLDYWQVAPILFLWMVKAGSQLIPNSEFGLRLFPMLCYFASIWLFYKIVIRNLQTPLSRVVAISLFVINASLIYYGSEVKQYICDILAFTTLIYLLWDGNRSYSSKVLWFGLCGVLFVPLSNVTPILWCTGGLYLLLEKKRSLPEWLQLVAGSLAVVAAFAVYYWFFIHNHPTRQYMQDFWSRERAFMPHDPTKYSFWFFWYEIIRQIFFSILRYKYLSVLMPVLTFMGISHLVKRKKWSLLLLLIFPFVLHIGLSSVHQYPAARRLMLYLSPGLILLGSLAFESNLLNRFANPQKKLALLLVPAALLFMLPFIPYPVEHQEIKQSLAYYEQHKQPNDNLYIFHSAEYAYKLYQAIGKIPPNERSWFGSLDVNNIGLYAGELSKNGGRTWMIACLNYMHELDKIAAAMEAGGAKLVQVHKVEGSSIYLFDIPEGFVVPADADKPKTKP